MQTWRDTRPLTLVLRYLQQATAEGALTLCGEDGCAWVGAQLARGCVRHSWSEARLRAHAWALEPLDVRRSPPVGSGALPELWWGEVPLLWEDGGSPIALSGVVWLPVGVGADRPAALRGGPSGWVTLLLDGSGVPDVSIWWPQGVTALDLAAKMKLSDPEALDAVARWLAAVMWREAMTGGAPPVIGDDGVRYWALPEEWRC